MLKKILLVLAAAALLLTGCQSGKPLPEGLEEDEIIKSGIQVMRLVVQGDYEAAHAMLREDQQAACTPEDFRDLALRELDGAGVYKQVERSMASGQSVDGESIGVAALYCEFSEEDVLFRVSFDQNMEFVGISIHEQ